MEELDIIQDGMDGVILLNKPEGITSFDAVNRCRRILHEKKTGHNGTLDPNASGLMIVLLGKYTKFLPYCISNHKRYHATFQFGSMTDTGDIWGNVINKKTPDNHTVEELQQVAESFLGQGTQSPPMYSALKVNGKKLYELARQGKTIEREARPIVIDSIQVTMEEGQWHLYAEVSSGTYIRTLINDLGEVVGELAVMSSLVRTGIESVSLEDAVTLEELEAHPRFATINDVIDPCYPMIETKQYEDVIHGRTVRLDSEVPVVLFQKDGVILAAYERREHGMYHCKRGLL